MKLFLVYFVLLILSSTKLFAEKSDEINPILQREQETFERSIVRRIYEMAMLDHDLYPERAKEMRKLLVMINNQNIRELFENTKRSFEEKDWPTYQENQILLIEKLQNLVNHMQSGELSSFKDQKERERFLLSQYNLGETLEAKHYFSLKAFIEQLELNIDWHSWILSEWENLDITNKIIQILNDEEKLSEMQEQFIPGNTEEQNLKERFKSISLWLVKYLESQTLADENLRELTSFFDNVNEQVISNPLALNLKRMVEDNFKRNQVPSQILDEIKLSLINRNTLEVRQLDSLGKDLMREKYDQAGLGVLSAKGELFRAIDLRGVLSSKIKLVEVLNSLLPLMQDAKDKYEQKAEQMLQAIDDELSQNAQAAYENLKEELKKYKEMLAQDNLSAEERAKMNQELKEKEEKFNEAANQLRPLRPELDVKDLEKLTEQVEQANEANKEQDNQKAQGDSDKAKETLNSMAQKLGLTTDENQEGDGEERSGEQGQDHSQEQGEQGSDEAQDQSRLDQNNGNSENKVNSQYNNEEENKDDWNKLPDIQRDEAMQFLRERFPTRYKEIIEAYYRALSEAENKR